MVGLIATSVMAENTLNIVDSSVNIATVAPNNAGDGPGSGTIGITYNITITSPTCKITGKIDTEMPANTALKLNLVAPTNCGGTSQGAVSLTATDANLVTGINTAGSDTGVSRTFSLTATSAVPAASASKTCTLTLLNE